jgi:thiol-disulfide isomerase/thioredoxin
VDAQFVGPLRSVSKGVDVTVFFGGWCSDSKRHVPHFLKIADEAGISADHIRFYALDRTLKSKDGTTERYHIKKVPTFIFSRDGVEVGRITESPETTLEADMLAILVAGSKR